MTGKGKLEFEKVPIDSADQHGKRPTKDPEKAIQYSIEEFEEEYPEFSINKINCEKTKNVFLGGRGWRVTIEAER